MSKRYNITLPDGIAEALEQWAEGEKNKPSTLAAFLVESAVRQAIDQGKIAPINPGQQSTSGSK
ncbi:hypothetical protein [Pseudanabaena sp. FACHB-2040]|uniref:ribbon-helix-helix domain-containing protein n=1 Tax=Pseudanabaena sp. FACHB-2040 TaxID=2692859 RepID=UPI0016873889|nr:hypothetical protein [Pseudanabaena sp. FACHB-2040]